MLLREIKEIRLLETDRVGQTFGALQDLGLSISLPSNPTQPKESVDPRLDQFVQENILVYELKNAASANEVKNILQGDEEKAKQQLMLMMQYFQYMFGRMKEEFSKDKNLDVLVQRTTDKETKSENAKHFISKILNLRGGQLFNLIKQNNERYLGSENKKNASAALTRKDYARTFVDKMINAALAMTADAASFPKKNDKGQDVPVQPDLDEEALKNIKLNMAYFMIGKANLEAFIRYYK